MTVINSEVDRKEFRILLMELAEYKAISEDINIRWDFYKRFHALYFPGTSAEPSRHQYSYIYGVMNDIKDAPGIGIDLSIDALEMNIGELVSCYSQDIKDKADEESAVHGILPCLRKLFDHISLERAHMDYTDKQMLFLKNQGETIDKNQQKLDKIEETAKKAEEQIEKLNCITQSTENHITELEDTADKLKSEMEKSKLDHIAILGIFASVVLTFISEIAFSTSVFNNIANASVYRIIMITSLIGLVFTNTIYALFSCIRRLVSNHNDNTADTHEKTKVSIFDRLKSPHIVSNVIFITVLLFTIVAWLFGFVEWRNDRIAFDEPQSPVTDAASDTNDAETTQIADSEESTVALKS